MLQFVKPTVSRYINPVLVETGTYDGAGVTAALEMGFPKVLSIELYDKFYESAVQKFAGDDRVDLYCGDSALMLWDVIKDVNQRITFWLDGHMFPGWNPAHSGIKVCPLQEEIAQISRHHIKDHVILIDDITNLFDRSELYGDLGFGKSDLEKSISNINANYKISYFDRGGTSVLLAATY